jgi:ankyrin repeat protein
MKFAREITLQVSNDIKGSRSSHKHNYKVAVMLRALLSTLLLTLLLSVTPTRAESFHEAAKAGNLEMVKQLVASGADVNARDTNEETPLHKAIWNGHFEVAKYLVDKGADVNARGPTGATPLMYACRAGIMWTFSRPLSGTFTVERPSPQISESDSFPYDGQLEIVKYLLVQGARLDLGNENGSTPLHEASDNGYVEIVRFLVEAGANVNAKTKSDGETPLISAATDGYVQTVKSLLDKGAEVNLRTTQNGLTPLMLSANRGHAEVVRLLLERGADPNIKDKSGNDALKVTTDAQIIEMLKKAGHRSRVKR